MTGKITSIGGCTLQWNMMDEKLYSPDGLQQLLPCERCGQPQWVSLRTVSVQCDACVEQLKGDDNA